MMADACRECGREVVFMTAAARDDGRCALCRLDADPEEVIDLGE